jgi:hypothetical protein
MNIHWLERGQLGSGLGLIGFALSLFAANPAAALDDTSMLFTGSYNYGGAVQTFYMPLGTGQGYGENYPSTGLGEQSAQLRMPAGTLSGLRVNVVTQNVPSGGTLEVIVRKNGNDTSVKCTVNAGGSSCGSGKRSVAIGGNNLVAIKVIHGLIDSGITIVNYTLVYN